MAVVNPSSLCLKIKSASVDWDRNVDRRTEEKHEYLETPTHRSANVGT